MVSLAYYNVLGLSLIVWAGILTLTSLLFTSLIGFLNRRGIRKIPFKWHIRMAIITIVLALFHGFLGISTLF